MTEDTIAETMRDHAERASQVEALRGAIVDLERERDEARARAEVAGAALHRSEARELALRRDVDRLERALGQVVGNSQIIVAAHGSMWLTDVRIEMAIAACRTEAARRFAHAPTTLAEVMQGLDLLEMDEDGNLPDEANEAEAAFYERLDAASRAMRARSASIVTRNPPRFGMGLGAAVAGSEGSDPEGEPR